MEIKGMVTQVWNTEENSKIVSDNPSSLSYPDDEIPNE